MSARSLEIPRPRLVRWVGGFLDADGVGEWRADGDDVLVAAADGATARLVARVPGELAGVTSLRTLVGRPGPLVSAVLLVRRGGYAVGVAAEGVLEGSKAGTRYVQSRTAAGGWSQQRYARRRDNQAQALVGVVADHLAALTAHRDDICALATGGDADLARRVLADPRLAPLAGLPRRFLDGIGEPRRAVLEDAARRTDALQVVVTEPQENPVPTSPELLPAAADAVLRLVEKVPAKAWDRPSPCEGWTARDVLNHLTSEHLWAPHLLRGETMAQVGDRYDGDVLGADVVGALRSALEVSMAAWAQADQSAHVDVSAGRLAVTEYGQQMLVDLVVHGWDIARATTTPYEPIADAIDAALRYETPRVEAHGTDGIFAAPIATSSRLRIDQLVALLGRDPHWAA